MPYYKFELRGGERDKRYEYAQRFDLKAADFTGHNVVFYKEHPATLEQLRRNHTSAAAGFDVEITQITKREYESRE